MQSLKIVNTFILLLVLSGCAEWQSLSVAVGTYGQKAADEAMKTKVWSLCNVTSIGSVNRTFDTPEKLAGFNTFCGLFK